MFRSHNIRNKFKKAKNVTMSHKINSVAHDLDITPQRVRYFLSARKKNGVIEIAEDLNKMGG